MPSRTSFFNKGIFFNNIKRFWLITFSYTLFLLIFAMGYLSSEVSKFQSPYNTNMQRIGIDIFSQSNDLMTVFLGFYCLISGLAVFSYMHFQKNTAMIHALPLKRETLFTTNYLSGLFLVSFPLLFNSAVIIITEAAYGFPRLDYEFVWLGVNLVLTFLLYTFTVFAGMFTGHMAAQAIFFLIYNFLAFFLESIINAVLGDFLYGYISTGYKFSAWSPLYYIMTLFSGFSRNEGNIAVVLGYLAAGVFFLIASYLLYRKRNMEVASDVISLQIVKPVFKYVVAFCSSALLGSILVAVLDVRKQLIPYILTYLFGGFIGYFSSEMLLKKTFRVFKAYKGFLIYAVILTLLLCSISLDLFGYERYVPNDNDVEIMYVSTYVDNVAKLALIPESYDPDRNSYLFNDPEFMNNPPDQLGEEHIKELRKMRGIAESREAITKARLIHDYIIKNEAALKSRPYSGGVIQTPVGQSTVQSRSLYFAYRLKNGTLVERSYNLTNDNFDEFDELLRDYLSVPEILEKYQPIVGKTSKDIRGIMVYYNNKQGEYKNIEITDYDDFLAAYQKDIMALDPLENMLGIYKDDLYNIDVSIELVKTSKINYLGTTTSHPLSMKFKNTLKYLISNGIISEDALVELRVNPKYIPE